MTSPFQVYRPGTISDAASLLRELDDEAAFYCGGTELLQIMKMGLADFSHLIDLKSVAGLGGISLADDGSLSIGATVTHREIERSPLIRERLPALASLERHVANVRVRNAGSIGGNLCFAEPHSDPAALLVAAGAFVHLSDARQARRVPLVDFLVGPMATVRELDEILVRIEVPVQPDGTILAYRKIVFYERPAASVAVRLTVEGGRVGSASVVVGSVGERPLIIGEAEAALVGVRVTDSSEAVEAAAAAAASGCDAYGDINGSEEYKRHLVAVLTRRAIGAAVEQADA